MAVRCMNGVLALYVGCLLLNVNDLIFMASCSHHRPLDIQYIMS